MASQAASASGGCSFGGQREAKVLLLTAIVAASCWTLDATIGKVGPAFATADFPGPDVDVKRELRMLDAADAGRSGSILFDISC